MKVIYGPYKNWFGPYQLAEFLVGWLYKPGKLDSTHPTTYKFGTWLAEDKCGNPSRLHRLLTWIDKHRKQHIYVRIDKHDTWSMDHTLAHIIVPMLYQLKQTKHGSPNVDDEDVPQHLQSTEAKPKEHDHDVDEFWHQRWDYVLNEMIWAFEQHKNPNSEDQFYHHPDPKPQQSIQDHVNNIKVDWPGLHQHTQRKQNGFRLFGKYYQCLWD